MNLAPPMTLPEDRSKHLPHHELKSWMIAIAVVLGVTAIGCGARTAAPEYQIVFESTLTLDVSNGLNPATNIWRVNSNGTDLKPLTKLISPGADCREAQPSPDGTQIVFVSARRL